MQLFRCLIGLALLGAGWACAAQADDPPRDPPPSPYATPAEPAAAGRHAWTFIAMPLVLHWQPTPEHRYAFAVALERRDTRDDWLQGLSLFRNSFGQPSAYAYVGKRWDNVWDDPRLTFKLTGGIMYGYVGQWKDRVPLNYNGFSPCVVPVLLYHLDRDRTFDVMVLGVGGVGFSFSYDF